MSKAERTVSAALSVGEPLAWTGRPRGGIYLAGHGALVLLCALAPGVVVLVGTVLRLGPPYLVPICWGLVVGGLLFLVFGRLLVGKIRKGHTFYGLTPRRAIIVSGIFVRRVRSIELASLREISVSERPDHSGSIVLGASPTGGKARPAGLMGLFWPGPMHDVTTAFHSIEDVRSVYDKVKEFQGKGAGG